MIVEELCCVKKVLNSITIGLVYVQKVNVEDETTCSLEMSGRRDVTSCKKDDGMRVFFLSNTTHSLMAKPSSEFSDYPNADPFSAVILRTDFRLLCDSFIGSLLSQACTHW